MKGRHSSAVCSGTLAPAKSQVGRRRVLASKPRSTEAKSPGTALQATTWVGASSSTTARSLSRTPGANETCGAERTKHPLRFTRGAYSMWARPITERTGTPRLRASPWMKGMKTPTSRLLQEPL